MLEKRVGEPLFMDVVTALEERYGDGAPQLVILAEDPLHKLARSRASRVFENKGLADVVRGDASRGEALVPIMNALKIDAMTVGGTRA